MLTREPTLKEAMDFLELNAYEGSNAITTLRMGDIEEILKPIRKLVNEHFNPQPYKFEDLKKGMWVWDDGEKCCFKCNPAISTDMAQCVTYNAFWYNCGEDEDEFFEEYDEFEEGRFFPVTKALEYQE